MWWLFRVEEVRWIDLSNVLSWQSDKARNKSILVYPVLIDMISYIHVSIAECEVQRNNIEGTLV